MKMIWLHTTRVSTVIAAFLKRYTPAEVKLDKALVCEPEQDWCTNRRLKSTREFSLVHNGVEVLSFHDGPNNMWAHESTRGLVEELKQQRLLRFSEEQLLVQQGWLSKVVGRLFGA